MTLINYFSWVKTFFFGKFFGHFFGWKFLFFFDETFVYVFGKISFFFGQNYFYLMKLHWENFIWQNFIKQTLFGKTSFDKTSFGVDWLWQVRQLLAMPVVLIYSKRPNRQTALHTHAQLYYRLNVFALSLQNQGKTLFQPCYNISAPAFC